MGVGACGYLPSNEWQIVRYPGTYTLLGRPSDIAFVPLCSLISVPDGMGRGGQAPLKGAAPLHASKHDPR